MQILTGSSDILPQLKENDAIKKIMRGQVQLQVDFIETLDDKELTICHAMKMCHVMEPSRRSSSIDVEIYLRRKLDEFHIKRY